MTALRAEVQSLLDQVPDNKLALLMEFLKSFIKKDVEKLTPQMAAYKSLQKYRKRGTADLNYKKELEETLSAKYENFN